jgi:hypothetical protein
MAGMRTFAEISGLLHQSDASRGHLRQKQRVAAIVIKRQQLATGPRTHLRVFLASRKWCPGGGLTATTLEAWQENLDSDRQRFGEPVLQTARVSKGGVDQAISASGP